jgi:hypothetical protein
MPRNTLRRSMTTIAVLVLLAASWAEAGVRPSSRARASDPMVPWSLFVQRLWTSLDGFLVKAGCSLDPSGANCPQSQPGDAGCSLDPDGACVQASPEADAGCSLDPDGHCFK